MAQWYGARLLTLLAQAFAGSIPAPGVELKSKCLVYNKMVLNKSVAFIEQQLKDFQNSRVPTSKLVEKIEEQRIFDALLYVGAMGQCGVIVDIRRGPFSAQIRRESSPCSDGYNATNDNPTRLTYLSLEKNTPENIHPFKCYGIYDPFCHPPGKSKFEKAARRDPEMKKFLDDILKYFN